MTTRILIGPKQRDHVQDTLDKKTQKNANSNNNNNNNKIILHMFQLEVDNDLATTLTLFLKTHSCQRIRIERCSGTSLGSLLGACLSSCFELELEDMEAFPMVPLNGEAADDNIICRLEKLSLKSMSLNASAASFIEQTGPTVSDLRLQQCQILQDDEEAMIRSLCSSTLLRRLNLSKCQLSASTMTAILRALNKSSSCHSFTELDISENDLSTEDAVLALRDLMISSSTQLKRLHTAKVRPFSIQPLAEALESKSTALTFWNLSGNQLTTPDMSILANMLSHQHKQQQSTLQTLYIHDNHFDDGILEPILKTWQHWSSLRCLWIFQNPALTCDCIQKLTQGLAEHQTHLYELQVPKSLTTMMTTTRAVSEENEQQRQQQKEAQRLLQSYQQDIRYWCELNRNGRYLLSKDIPLALWPLVLAKAAAQPSKPATLLERLTSDTKTNNKDADNSKSVPNAAYHFLHGPAALL